MSHSIDRFDYYMLVNFENFFNRETQLEDFEDEDEKDEVNSIITELNLIVLSILVHSDSITFMTAKERIETYLAQTSDSEKLLRAHLTLINASIGVKKKSADERVL